MKQQQLLSIITTSTLALGLCSCEELAEGYMAGLNSVNYNTWPYYTPYVVPPNIATPNCWSPPCTAHSYVAPTSNVAAPGNVSRNRSSNSAPARSSIWSGPQLKKSYTAEEAAIWYQKFMIAQAKLQQNVYKSGNDAYGVQAVNEASGQFYEFANTVINNVNHAEYRKYHRVHSSNESPYYKQFVKIIFETKDIVDSNFRAGRLTNTSGFDNANQRLVEIAKQFEQSMGL